MIRQVTVNGKACTLASASLTELLATEGLTPLRRGVAVSLNSRVVPRSQWPLVELEEGDEIEIVAPFAGG